MVAEVKNGASITVGLLVIVSENRTRRESEGGGLVE